ncbi:MAG: coproporphyrinogen III oxidase, partial [Boseongicola sp.]|nr:coproporphyrinogen III oxidase [Boseongicola sp.]
LFGYAHVPWMAKKQRLIDEAALPGPAERLRQAQLSAKALVEAGYVPIGLDHFALPDDSMTIAAQSGRLRRNFQGYTTDQADIMLGVGATSIGKSSMGFVQNTTETGAWARAVEGGVLPTAKGYALQGEDRLRSYVIEQLMCVGSVDLDEATRRFEASPSWYRDTGENLTEMERDGLIERVGNMIKITEKGAVYVRVIAAAFDAYLTTSKARHAVTV